MPNAKNSRPTHYGPAGRFSYSGLSVGRKERPRLDDGGNPGANVTGLPSSENFVFCRSLAVHAPPDAVVEHFGNMDVSVTTPGILSAILNIEGADVPVAVAIQPVSADKSQIHVTAGQAGAENVIQPLRLRVSAWARRLRDTIENQTEKEAQEDPNNGQSCTE